MKITDVEAIHLSCPMQKPFVDATYVNRQRDAVIVRVSTDEGVTGIGESWCLGGPPMTLKLVVEKELRDYVVGEDPLDTERLWEKMYQGSIKRGRKGILLEGISGIDIALWDIRGKVAKMPLYKLLGGYRDRVRVYASGGFYGESGGTNELVEEMAAYARRGFTAAKLKIGRVSLLEDVERVKAIRAAVGDNMDLMVDANCSYRPYEAIKMGRKLEKYNIFWFEEPVACGDLEGSAEVARAIDIPVAAGENEYTRYDFRDQISKKAADILQPDLTVAGGITEAKKISAMADAWNISCAPHCFSVVAFWAALHFAASIPNALVLEFDGHPNPLREVLSQKREAPIAIGENGCVQLPDAPGLGVELDESALARYRAQ